MGITVESISKGKQGKGFYNRKSQHKSRLYGQRAKEILQTKYGLVDVLIYKCQTTRRMLEMNFTREPYAGKPHIRIDEGEKIKTFLHLLSTG